MFFLMKSGMSGKLTLGKIDVFPNEIRYRWKVDFGKNRCFSSMTVGVDGKIALGKIDVFPL